jgi:hypothetical protein
LKAAEEGEKINAMIGTLWYERFIRQYATAIAKKKDRWGLAISGYFSFLHRIKYVEVVFAFYIKKIYNCTDNLTGLLSIYYIGTYQSVVVDIHSPKLCAASPKTSFSLII